MPGDAPPPGPAAAAASARLAARIREEMLAAGGALPFARFMELALYAPGFGYYSGGATKLGPDGDFVTAPEISALFARCLARPVAAVLEATGGDVLEVGPGTGRLAAELLPALKALGIAPRRYLLLERSAELRARQAATLARRCPGAEGRVAWLDALPESGLQGVVLANEVLDAIPAHRLAVTAAGIAEWWVTEQGERFVWHLGGLSHPELGRRAQSLLERLPEPLAEGYVLEVAPAREAWVESVAARIEAGAMLLLDYGYGRAEYYHPQRLTGTLACHYRHRRHEDPLILPGLQDLSVHVEFSAIAEAGARAGLSLAGYTTQAEFLLATGLLEHAAVAPPGSSEQIRWTGEIKRLVLPGEMGTLVKVMALSRSLAGPVPGFEGRDHRARL